jgi:hypothetical protein
VSSLIPPFSAKCRVIAMSNSPQPCSSSLKGGFLKSLLSASSFQRTVLRTGFSNDGCSLYVTLSMKDAGISDPSCDRAIVLMDHFRIGNPSPAGGTSERICCCVTSFTVRSIYALCQFQI